MGFGLYIRFMDISLKRVARERAELSKRRGDEKQFSEEGFLEFAESNSSKYNIDTKGDDLVMNSWYFNDLISDYKHTL